MTYDKKVRGIRFDDERLEFTNIEVRISADNIGKTLSLIHEDIQLTIPLDSVEDVLQLKRR